MVSCALSSQSRDYATWSLGLGWVKPERNRVYRVEKVDREVVRNEIHSFERNLQTKAILHRLYVLIVAGPVHQPNSISLGRTYLEIRFTHVFMLLNI